MNFIRKSLIGVVGIVLSSAVLVSCGSATNEEVEPVEGIKLNIGAVVENIDGEYYNFNYDNGKYVKNNSDELIGLYDYKSNNYVFQEEDKFKAFTNGKIVEIDGLKNDDIRKILSPNGKYISYFRKGEDEILLPHIINIENNEEIDTQIKTDFYWKHFDWISENEVIYYGVNDDYNGEKVSGIFIYNIDTKEEKLVMDIHGYVQFIKNVDNGIVFLQETIENKRILKEINPETGEEKIISEDVINISDVIKVNGEYYILGEKKDSNSTLYKICDGHVKKMVYDFPKAIRAEGGLIQDSDNNVLFVGVEDDNSKSRIYMCKPDGTISKVSNEGKEFKFISRY